MMFSPPEFFMLGLLGLCATAASTDGSMTGGLIACAFGLMIVGYDQVSGEVRFTAAA
jgi:putative tricarboxylic transport membrane protein